MNDSLMLNALSCSTATLPLPPVDDKGTVKLIDGRRISLATLSDEELSILQYDQERAFAKAIVAAPRDSTLREETVKHAYQTVCEILDELSTRDGGRGSLSMGMDPRYKKLVLGMLNQRRLANANSALFEVGFGSGLLLQAAAVAEHVVGGLEVAPQLFDCAARALPHECRSNLLLGDFRRLDLTDHVGRYGVVYWNDVMEHIATDEIEDYLRRINSLLVPGGNLITITPNWHMRPSDVTCQFLPPRSEPIGFHLKEYTLGEAHRLLLNAGFREVTTPTFISRQTIFMPKWIDMTPVKLALEPFLEKMPYRIAVQICRRFGFNLTIATK